MRSEEPLVERDLRSLKNRADRDAKLLPASTTLVDAFSHFILVYRGLFGLQLVNVFGHSEVRTERSSRPKFSLKIFAGFIGIVEARCCIP